MIEKRKRIYHLKGSAQEVGFTLGQMMGKRLEYNIKHYIQNGPNQHGLTDWNRLRHGALPWFRTLPKRFQEEMEGMAEGAKIPLQQIAEWNFVEECMSGGGCSSFMCTAGEHIWVARNNDLWVPELWGYVNIREVNNRIPTISFGLEGETFIATGINQERLWLHYNYLPVWDIPAENIPSMAPYVLLTIALETCRTLDDVEALLNSTPRTGGMMIFAADGKTDTCAIFECNCSTHVRRELSDNWIAGTNHYCVSDMFYDEDGDIPHSHNRYMRMTQLLNEYYATENLVNPPWDFVNILADADVEQRGKDAGTVYANIVCPSQKILWYTFGGYPAASTGNWQQIEWPWA